MSKLTLLLCLVATTLGVSVQAQHNPWWWDGRNTIVHLFEWKWNDIAEECENFLAPRGFAGIQVSPVTENIISESRSWWERYQPISYELTTRSGNESEFADMVRRCNDVGVRIYVDVLLNHMSGGADGVLHGTGGSTAQPSIKSYPAVPYGEGDFHPSCGIDNWNDRYQVQNCELVGLRDLNQGSDYVRGQLVSLMDRLVELGVAGFRIDAAKHIDSHQLWQIVSSNRDLNTDHGFPPNARPFIYQEVIDHGGESISRDEYTGFGTVTEFRFAESISHAFLGHNKLKYLQNVGHGWGFLPSHLALIFIDNHDTQRDGGEVLNYKTAKQYKMATAFELAYPYGISQVMSSFAFDHSDDAPPADETSAIISPEFDENGGCINGWVCEHRWRQVYNMIGFKNAVVGTYMNNWWDNWDNQIAFCRGSKGFVAFNGNHYDLRQTLQTCLPEGRYCDVISGDFVDGECTGKVVEVGKHGLAHIVIGANEEDGVLALHIEAKL